VRGHDEWRTREPDGYAHEMSPDEFHRESCCNDHDLHDCDLDGYTALCWTCAELIAATLSTLAANLRDAAGLCAAFELGREREYSVQCQSGRNLMREMRSDAWAPGCQRAVREK
jgi:hypothetical protein